MDIVVVVNIRKMNSSRIGTLVVVCNRAVIENQSCVCLVVCKDVIFAVWTVFRQRQCHPVPQHYFVFFESTSCKNSETSCLESRRNFDGVKLIRNRCRNRYTSCISVLFKGYCIDEHLQANAVMYHRYNQIIQDKKKLKSTNPHSMQDFVVLFVYVLMHSLPGIVDGARKTSQVSKWVRAGARGRRHGFSSLPMVEATASSSRDQCITVLL